MKRTLSHTVWECKYHIVWVPKKRRKVIFGKLRREIGTIVRRLCQYKQVEMIEGNACIDHVHLCIAIPLEVFGINDGRIPEGEERDDRV